MVRIQILQPYVHFQAILSPDGSGICVCHALEPHSLATGCGTVRLSLMKCGKANIGGSSPGFCWRIRASSDIDSLKLLSAT